MDDNFFQEHFTTSDKFNNIKEDSLVGPNGWLLFVACNSAIEFTKIVKEKYENYLHVNNGQKKSVPLIGTEEDPITRVFSDTETCPRLPIHVAGANVYVFQCIHENLTNNTVNENIQQLLQVISTLRAHRAQTITVVTPYSPYSRQDKPSFMKREAALASLFANQLKVAGVDIYLTYHPHTLSLYGFYEPEIKFVALSGHDLFRSVFDKLENKEEIVVVSTDAGGAKSTIHFSESLGSSYAISSKFRREKDKSNLIGVIGDLENKKTAIITDDETVTGNSIINTIKTLNKYHGIEQIYVGVTHFKVNLKTINKFVEAHEKYGLKELHITNTIPQKPGVINHDFIKIHGLNSIFAATINKLHYNQSVSEIFSRL